MPESESEFVQHTPCEACGSSDAKAVSPDGHSYCFSCMDYSKESETDVASNISADPSDTSLIQGSFAALAKRGITEKTCRKFGYQIGTYKGSPVHIAPFHDSKGALCAQHIRFPNKDFSWIGSAKQATLFGQQLWRDSGKMVVITEGEIDCMSISQLQDNRWPVVSIRSGAWGAKKDIAKAVDWLNGFESVVLAFDIDDPGCKQSSE